MIWISLKKLKNLAVPQKNKKIFRSYKKIYFRKNTHEVFVMRNIYIKFDTEYKIF